MTRSLCLAIATVLSLLLPHHAEAAHKIGEYYSSYYSRVYYVLADSAAERVFVFMEAGRDSTLAAIELAGEDEIVAFATRLEQVLSQWDAGRQRKGALCDATVHFTSDREWHGFKGQPLRMAWKRNYVMITARRCKSGGVVMPAASMAFTYEELRQFAAMLRDSYHAQSWDLDMPDGNVLVM